MTKDGDEKHQLEVCPTYPSHSIYGVRVESVSTSNDSDCNFVSYV